MLKTITKLQVFFFLFLALESGLVPCVSTKDKQPDGNHYQIIAKKIKPEDKQGGTATMWKMKPYLWNLSVKFL